MKLDFQSYSLALLIGAAILPATFAASIERRSDVRVRAYGDSVSIDSEIEGISASRRMGRRSLYKRTDHAHEAAQHRGEAQHHKSEAERLKKESDEHTAEGRQQTWVHKNLHQADAHYDRANELAHESRYHHDEHVRHTAEAEKHERLARGGASAKHH